MLAFFAKGKIHGEYKRSGHRCACTPEFTECIRERVAAGRVSWTGPLLLLPARSILWMTAQSVVALLFLVQHRPHPWREACYWWSVCFTSADIICILAMRFFLKREGLRLRDLNRSDPHALRARRVPRHRLFSAVLSGILRGRIHHAEAVLRDGSKSERIHPAFARAPLWALVYSLVIMWPINSVVEEMTYQGYVLPRLEALTGCTWAAFVAVAFWFTLQHCALGFVADWRGNMCRFFGFLPGCVIMILIYLRTRRLAPIIVGHWIIDLSAVLMTAVW